MKISRKFRSVEELLPFAPFHLIAQVEMDWAAAAEKNCMDIFPDCDDLGELNRFAFEDLSNQIYVCSININIPCIATIETNSLAQIDFLIFNFFDCLQINENEVVVHKIEIEHIFMQSKGNTKKDID